MNVGVEEADREENYVRIEISRGANDPPMYMYIHESEADGLALFFEEFRDKSDLPLEYSAALTDVIQGIREWNSK